MTRKPMEEEQMHISERWRWRFLACWVVVFTMLVAYGLLQIREITDDNRDALCSIHRVHRGESEIIAQIPDKMRETYEPILAQIQAEEEVLAHLECG